MNKRDPVHWVGSGCSLLHIQLLRHSLPASGKAWFKSLGVERFNLLSIHNPNHPNPHPKTNHYNLNHYYPNPNPVVLPI